MRDAGHEVLVGAGARPGPISLQSLDLVGERGGTGAARHAAGRGGLGQSLGHEFAAVVQGLLGRGPGEGFAGEAREIDVGVGRDDHRVGGRDLGGGEPALRADRALRLHADLVAQSGGGFLQRLGRHERVRDAGRTRRDRHQPTRTGGRHGNRHGNRRRDRREFGQGRLERRLRVPGGGRRARLVDRPAREARRVHRLVHRQDREIGGGDLFGRETRRGADDLDLDGVAGLKGKRPQRLRRELSMSGPDRGRRENDEF